MKKFFELEIHTSAHYGSQPDPTVPQLSILVMEKLRQDFREAKNKVMNRTDPDTVIEEKKLNGATFFGVLTGGYGIYKDSNGLVMEGMWSNG